jgi:hypothetical protein
MHREDFTSRFITTGTSVSDGTTLPANTDGKLPLPPVRRRAPFQRRGWRMLLLATSIADGIPVSLSDTLTGIDRRLTVRVIVHATWHAGLRFGMPDASPHFPGRGPRMQNKGKILTADRQVAPAV